MRPGQPQGQKPQDTPIGSMVKEAVRSQMVKRPKKPPKPLPEQDYVRG